MSTKTLLVQGHNAGGETRRVKVTATPTDSSGDPIDAFDADGAIIEPAVGYLDADDGELLLPLVPNAEFTRPVSGSRYTVTVGRHSYVIVKNTSNAQTLDSAITATAEDIEDVRFDDLADVNMTGVADGDVPVWDSTTETWLPGAGGGGGVTSVDGNTGAVTASQLLTSIKTVDGAGSGLDADLLDGQSSAAFEAAGTTATHIADTTDAHAASAITNTPAGNISATTVQAAIDELDTEKLSTSAATGTYVPFTGAGSNVDLGSHTLTTTGEVTAKDFNVTGLTGATAASRYVGATSSGAPASGTFAIGDYVIDRTGKMWICTVAGSPGTWVATGVALLEENILNSDASSLTCGTSIPGTYRSLLLLITVRSTVSATNDTGILTINGDTTTANYDRQVQTASGSSVTAAEVLAGATSRNCINTTGATSPSNHFATHEVFIPNYAGSTFKTLQVSSFVWQNRSASGLKLTQQIMGWASTSAITGLVLTPVTGPNFLAGSKAQLYGIG